MTPMQHTRIHARCQSARRLSCRLSRKPTAPVDVQMPLSLRPQKTHPGLLERPRSLLSIIWDTEVRTSPPRVGTGGVKRLGNRLQARRQGARGPGTAGHRVTRTTRPIRPRTAATAAIRAAALRAVRRLRIRAGSSGRGRLRRPAGIPAAQRLRVRTRPEPALRIRPGRLRPAARIRICAGRRLSGPERLRPASRLPGTTSGRRVLRTARW
jgi:hypothetical protein